MRSRRSILRLIPGRKSSFPFAIRRLFQFQSITCRVRNCTIDTGRFAVLKKSGRTRKKWRIEAARYGSESDRRYLFRFFFTVTSFTRTIIAVSYYQNDFSAYLVYKFSLELSCFEFNAAAHSALISISAPRFVI